MGIFYFPMENRKTPWGFCSVSQYTPVLTALQGLYATFRVYFYENFLPIEKEKESFPILKGKKLIQDTMSSHLKKRHGTGLFLNYVFVYKL